MHSGRFLRRAAEEDLLDHSPADVMPINKMDSSSTEGTNALMRTIHLADSEATVVKANS